MTASPPPDDGYLQLLLAHQGLLRGVILAGLGSHADCQDVLQKTNLALWKKAADYDRERPFRAWAIGIARFEILAYIRDRQRDRHIFSTETAELMVAEAEEQLQEPSRLQTALRACLLELPEPRRELLTLKYVRRWSIRQIADRLGRSADAVKCLLLRLRRGLGTCIERRLAASPEPR